MPSRDPHSESTSSNFISDLTKQVNFSREVGELCDDFDYQLARIHEKADTSIYNGDEKLEAFIRINQEMETLLRDMKPRICELIKEPRRLRKAVTEKKGSKWAQSRRLESVKDAIEWVCDAMNLNTCGNDKEDGILKKVASELKKAAVVSRFIRLLVRVVTRSQEHDADSECWERMRQVIEKDPDFYKVNTNGKMNADFLKVLSRLALSAPTYLKPILTTITTFHTKRRPENLTNYKNYDWLVQQPGSIILLMLAADSLYELGAVLPPYSIHVEFQGAIMSVERADKASGSNVLEFRVTCGTSKGSQQLHEQFKLLACILPVVFSDDASKEVAEAKPVKVIAKGYLFTTMSEFKIKDKLALLDHQGGVQVKEGILQYDIENVFEYY
ncbi:hypothetical protein BJ508DRAFT_359627 [Ascobolus immersus RN42]|uniref:Uncharacterized protein n=1 Tax=Ascobolus immersus RN42 TaxID=1160509 RepID=A0A3N4IG65_ASCIM|nr:hypothetical protein BJ508DRAFT_359627 [Ascobolus immersus RN42]